MSQATGNPPHRPAKQPSRRRWAAARAALNRVLKQDKAPAVTVLRAVELMLAIHEMPYPGGVDKRDKRMVRELVQETVFEQALIKQVDDEMLAQERAEQERLQAESARVFDSVLDGQDG